AIAHLDRTGRYIVGPEVEGAPAVEIEPSVVPVTGQNAVLDAAALERKAHVRTPVVEGKDAPAIVHDEDRTVMPVHHEPPLGLNSARVAGERDFLFRRVHGITSGGRCP